jgi:hypothetical protein
LVASGLLSEDGITSWTIFESILRRSHLPAHMKGAQRNLVRNAIEKAMIERNTKIGIH